MMRGLLVAVLSGCSAAVPLVCDAPTSVCDEACVDLATDPMNCGGCGHTCVIGAASAACEDGECTLGACDRDWADCDGSVENGCETDARCESGAVCRSSCGSDGSLSCTDVCAPTCTPPREACNATDDDCDGVCDEGALPGCRVGVHRSFGALGHVYANDTDELKTLGQNVEATDYFYLYDAAHTDLRPLYRCRKGSGKRLLTTDTACEGLGAQEFSIGFIGPTPSCGSVVLHRLLSSDGSNHFYTVSDAERDRAVKQLGYTEQRPAGYVWRAP